MNQEDNMTFDASMKPETQTKVQKGQKKSTKPRKLMKVLREEHLTNKNDGLCQLYFDLKRKKEKILKSSVVDPSKAMGQYLACVREWSYNLNPKYEQGYFLDKVRTLGKTNTVSMELGSLRKVHTGKLEIDVENQDYILAKERPAPSLQIPALHNTATSKREKRPPVPAFEENRNLVIKDRIEDPSI